MRCMVAVTGKRASTGMQRDVLRMTVEKGSGDPADQTPWQRRTVREGDGVDEADGT